MKYTYTVTGMTCSSCKAIIEKSILQLESVHNTSVNLNTKVLTVHSDKNLSAKTIQEALPNKYKVLNSSFESFTESKETVVQQLYPLFLVFVFITGAAILLNTNPWRLEHFMLDFMGLFYVVFSFFKFLDYRGFPKSFKGYDPLAKAIPIYAWIYPFIELGLGIMFLMRLQTSLALIFTLIILGITTIGVTQSLLNKKTIECACLGTALKLPMTKATFIENSIMIIMAIIMLLKTYN